MRITIANKNKKISNNEIRESIRFFISKLTKSKTLKQSLSIKVRFNPEVSQETGGWTEWGGDDNHKPREFLIEVCPEFGRFQTLKTLSHECVHVIQFARGHLKDLVRANGVSWKGRAYYGKFETMTSDDYWLAPWEIEAYGKEFWLYFSYMKHKRKKKY